MGKTRNVKKAASAMYGTHKAIQDAMDGKYLIAKIEKALGFCAFNAIVEMPNGSTRPVQVLVRGKYKGSKGPTRIEPGCFVIVDGDPMGSKMLEVVGIANQQSAVDSLKAAKRGKAFVHDAGLMDDLFDRSEDAENDMTEEDLEELMNTRSMASHLMLAYKSKSKGATAAPAIGSAADSDDSEGPDLFHEATSEAARRRRHKKVTATPSAAPVVTDAAYTTPDEDEHPVALKSRPTPTSWEDEIDIDAL